MEISFRVEVLILIAIILVILFGNTFVSCMRSSRPSYPSSSSSPSSSTKEGFSSQYRMNMDANEQASFNLTDDKPINTTSWFTPNLSYTKGTSPGAGVQDILNRPKQPVPLPEGEMLLLATTEFKPECCPNAYSNSTGCACMTVDQYNYLIDRGGNNVPYSEY